jgi:tetratricopeptide (TPR) repeat protein
LRPENHPDPIRLGHPETTVRREVETNIRTNPAKSLDILCREGKALSPQERATLAQRAANELAGRAITAEEPRAALEEMRQARAQAEGISQDVARTLRALEARIERRVLVRTLEDVSRSGARGDWVQAGKQAQEPMPGIQVPANVTKTLTEVARLSAFDRLQTAVKSIEPNRPLETATALRPLEVNRLPESLQSDVRGLRGLSEVRSASAQPWQGPPNVAALKQSLAEFRAAIGDARLTGRLQQDLAVKAFFEGHVAEARSLLPEGGPPEHAATLLRDMKAMMLGQGDVVSEPAQRALGPKPGEGDAGPRGPPPGLQPLIPEAGRDGWRPQPKESALADLPPAEVAQRLGDLPPKQAAQPLDDLPPQLAAKYLEQPLRRQIETGIAGESRSIGERKTEVLHSLHGLEQQLQQQDQDDDAFIAAVEALLKRKLSPAERASASEMRRQGKKAADVADELRKAGQAKLDSAEAYCERAAAHAEDAEFEQAIADCGEAIRIAPKETCAYLVRGTAYRALGDYDKAIADYSEVIRLEPKYTAAYVARGDVYRGKKEYAKAIADCDKAITFISERENAIETREWAGARGGGGYEDERARLAALAVDAYHTRGWTWSDQKEYARALANFGTAVELAPKDASVYIVRGNFYYHPRKHYDQAIAEYTRASELDPTQAAAYVGRGNAYRRKGDYARALEEYGEALKVAPVYRQAHLAFAWLLATCPEEKVRDGAKALEHAKKADELPGRSIGFALEVMAAARAEVGQFDEAVKWQKKALESRGLSQEELTEARQRLQLYEQKKPYREKLGASP